MARILCSCGESVTVEDVSTAELARSLSRLDAEMSRSLARIEGKLDRVTDDHESRLRTLERVDVAQMKKDYEDRLRTLERWMWGLGGTGLGTGLISLILQLADRNS